MSGTLDALFVSPVFRSRRLRVWRHALVPNQKFLEFMCQHLLAIAWYQGQTNPEGQFNRPPECKLASAFLVHPVVDNFEFTLLATAAHIFTDYEKDTTKKGLTARSHVLFDAWGPKAKCGLPIPCNIFEEPRSFLDDLDTGRDYAFVQLFDFYHRPLSQTTTPFPRDVWAGADLDRFNQFFMGRFAGGGGERCHGF